MTLTKARLLKRDLPVHEMILGDRWSCWVKHGVQISEVWELLQL